MTNLQPISVAALSSVATNFNIASIATQEGPPAPETCAKAVLSHLRKGIGETLRAAEICSFALEAFAPQSSERRRFFDGLVTGGFLSEAEARAEGQSPKVSKLNLIGANASVLRRAEVLEQLPDGYSCIYEATQLYLLIAKQSETPVETFVSTLQEAGGDINREFLTKQRKLRKCLKHAPGKKDASFQGEVINTVATTPDPAKPLADLVYLTPNATDTRRFSDDYASPDSLGGIYRVNRLVSEKAIGLSVTDVANLPVVIDRIFPLSGFTHIRKIYLLEKPEYADITTAKVAVVATRFRNQEIPDVSDLWSTKGDGKTLATELSPDAQSKLHVFSRGKSPGWECLDGDAVWSELPSLKGAIS